MMWPELGDLALLLESQGHNRAYSSLEIQPQDSLVGLSKHCWEVATTTLVYVSWPSLLGQKPDLALLGFIDLLWFFSLYIYWQSQNWWVTSGNILTKSKDQKPKKRKNSNDTLSYCLKTNLSWKREPNSLSLKTKTRPKQSRRIYHALW